VAGIDGGEDLQEGGIWGEVLRCRGEGGTCADCEFLIWRFRRQEGEEARGWVYRVFVDVLGLGLVGDVEGRGVMYDVWVVGEC
jgi:hypothetical protein